MDLLNARMYVTTYKKYNEGSCSTGTWAKLSDYNNATEFFSHFRQLNSDEEDPEFMFQDYSNLPESLYAECMTENELQVIIDLINIVPTEQELAFEVFCDNFATEFPGKTGQEVYDMFVDKYIGETSLVQYFQEQYEAQFEQLQTAVEHNYELKNYAELVKEMALHFDWDALARTYETSYTEQDGFLFYR